MHGLTIGYNGNTPSNDSYGMSVAGAWPEGYRSWLGASGHDFDGDEFKLGQRQGPEATIGTKAMIAEWWQQPSSNDNYLEAVKLWSQVDNVSGANGNAEETTGQDVSYWFGPRQSSSNFNIDGNFESSIVFNPGWSKNGIALCGYNKVSTSMENDGTACLTVDDWGNTTTTGALSALSGLKVAGASTLNGNLNIGAGYSITLTPSSGNVSPYLYASSATTISLANNSGVYVGISALGNNYFGATKFSGPVTSSSTLSAVASIDTPTAYASLPTSPVDGEKIYCSDCAENSITGVELIYHATGSEWTDLINGTSWTHP